MTGGTFDLFDEFTCGKDCYTDTDDTRVVRARAVFLVSVSGLQGSLEKVLECRE